VRDTNAAVTELVTDGATRALQIYSQVRAEGLRYPSAVVPTQGHISLGIRCVARLHCTVHSLEMEQALNARLLQAQLPWRRSAIAFLGGVLRRCDSLHPSVRRRPDPKSHVEPTVAFTTPARAHAIE